MDYEKLIKKIYKLLIVYERYEFAVYKSYLISLIQLLDGMESSSDIIEETKLRLKGLHKWSEEDTTHDYVKDCVLDSCNKLKREH